MGSGDGFVLLIVVLLATSFYFLPTIIAVLRHVPNVGSVAVINTFLGWTFIGWIVALSMAARSRGGASMAVNVGPGGWHPVPVMPAQLPAGWYRDPHGQAGSRYWDGSTWTQHIH
jgi:hypothetical protein